MVRETTEVMIRFECGREDRISQDFGPFRFAQLTYGDLRVESVENGNEIDLAYYTEGRWWLPDDTWYTDVVIYGVVNTTE